MVSEVLLICTTIRINILLFVFEKVLIYTSIRLFILSFVFEFM